MFPVDDDDDDESLDWKMERTPTHMEIQAKDWSKGPVFVGGVTSPLLSLRPSLIKLTTTMKIDWIVRGGLVRNQIFNHEFKVAL